MTDEEQMDLLAYNGEPPHVDVDTSIAAAHSMREAADSIRKRVFERISETKYGMTCDEIEVALDLRHQTASARLRELVLQGRLVDSKVRRLTRSGRWAVVYQPKATT